MKVIKFSEFEPTNEGAMKDKAKEMWADFKKAIKNIGKFEADEFSFKDVSDWFNNKRTLKEIIASKPASPDTKLD